MAGRSFSPHISEIVYKWHRASNLISINTGNPQGLFRIFQHVLCRNAGIAGIWRCGRRSSPPGPGPAPPSPRLGLSETLQALQLLLLNWQLSHRLHVLTTTRAVNWDRCGPLLNCPQPSDGSYTRPFPRDVIWVENWPLCSYGSDYLLTCNFRSLQCSVWSSHDDKLLDPQEWPFLMLSVCLSLTPSVWHGAPEVKVSRDMEYRSGGNTGTGHILAKSAATQRNRFRLPYSIGRKSHREGGYIFKFLQYLPRFEVRCSIFLHWWK